MATLPGRTSDYLNPFKILVVEPNPLMRRVTRNLLHLLGARRVVDTTDSRTAIDYIEGGGIDFVLSEWYLVGSHGVELVRWLRQSSTDIRFTPFIMVTSQTRVENIVAARNLGISEFVAKPFSAQSLISRIREVVERPRPFVHVGKYFGPDRRRRAKKPEDHSDRRKTGTLLIGSNDMTQEQINRVVSGNSSRS